MRAVAGLMYEGKKDEVYANFKQSNKDVMLYCQWTDAAKRVMQLLFPKYIKSQDKSAVDDFLQNPNINGIIKERLKEGRLKKSGFIIMQDAMALKRAAIAMDLLQYIPAITERVKNLKPSNLTGYCEQVVRQLITVEQMHEKAIEHPDYPIDYASLARYCGVLKQSLSEVFEKLQLQYV